MNNSFKHVAAGSQFYALVFLFLALQYFRLAYQAPPPEYIWDNVYLWDWARNFGNLDFSTFVADSHHQLRWGNWGFAAVIIKLFSDEIFYYYLSTIIPSSIAIVIFIHFAWKHIGVVGALAFIALWYYDALLFRATFQLLPSGAALLPVAVMLSLCARVIKLREISLTMLVAISFTMFWLYGTKETHLAYLPAVMWLLYRFGGVRAVLSLIAIFGIGYVGETFFFLAIDPDFSLLGRVHSVMDGGQHVTIMTESVHYVGQQTRYFDSGITMRWSATTGMTPVILFVGFILCVLVLAQRDGSDLDTWNFTKLLAVLILSFFVCTTFFVISISPIRLGHGVVPRYVTTLLPLVYLLVIGFSAQQLANTRRRYKVLMLALIPFLVAPSIHRYKQYPELSISEVSQQYNKFAATLANYECVRARQKSIVMNQLDFVPQARRSPNTVHMIGNDDNTIYKKPWFIAKADLSKECQSMYTINRIAPMRY